jgi:hypothetical protein
VALCSVLVKEAVRQRTSMAIARVGQASRKAKAASAVATVAARADRAETAPEFTTILP